MIRTSRAGRWLCLAAVAGGLACGSVARAQPPQPPPTAKPEVRAPTQPMPVPRTLVKHRGQRTIYIDGSLQDWPQAVPLLLLSDPRQLSGTALGAWRGPRDLAAEAFMLWDADDLFVAVVVSDEWHRALTKDSPRLLEIPPADCVMLSFDPRRDTKSIGADPGREEDRDFWLADVEGQGRKLVLWDRLRGTARYGSGAVTVVKHDRKKGMTTYEARIPWTEILPGDVRPAPDLVIDMQIVVNDFDELTDPIPQTRIGWTFGAGARIDPGLLGSLQLVTELERTVQKLPEFPPPPESGKETVPGPAHWVELRERLERSQPVVVTPESQAPATALSDERLEVLTEIERHTASFPRVDYLEYHYRTHRRMRREAAGMIATGLPFFWQHTLASLGRRAAGAAPAEGFRIFRLPTGGWLVRSNEANFGIDPAGYDLGRHAFGAFDFAVLTDPGELTKRNDQLLLRLASAKRPIYTHLAFHLPGFEASKMSLVTLGESYRSGGLRVRMLGLREGGLVSATVGLIVYWPDGTVLVHSGRGLTEKRLREALPASHPVDLLVLSAKHPDALALGRAVGARLIVLDDVLQCSARAGPEGRVALDDAFALQAGLLPAPSVILAPGESLAIEPGS